MNTLEDEFRRKREQMVTTQIERRGVTNPRVLNAMRSVPRHLFVNFESQEFAYADYPLPIGYEQTISQPYIVALMTSLLDLQGDEKVLEIGTGSGYQAAILSLLAREIHTVEIIPQLAGRAEETLLELGMTNVKVHHGDGSLGWTLDAPYDAIMVTASAPDVPPPLLDQLRTTGKLVIPIGHRGSQLLELWTMETGAWQPDEILPVAFVPLRGKHGWKGYDL
jgi:protein-L-isoaspartate(D-aspartate) O-methyltransferase